MVSRHAHDFLAAFQDSVEHRPECTAVWWPAGGGAYSRMNYGELGALGEEYTRALWNAGLRRGMRACVLVPPGPELGALFFALVRIGVVPVLIDPGIAKTALRACIAESAPEAFIGVPLAHAARVVLGWGRSSVRVAITVGRRWFWGGPTLKSLCDQVGEEPPEFHPDPDALAGIAFTSGSTGPPKGVEFRGHHLGAQMRLAGQVFPVPSGMVGMSTFPPFSLAGPALGLSMVVPDMDPVHPAEADPATLVTEIDRFGVGGLFGSPALLDRLSRYCVTNDIELSSLSVVTSAGASLDPRIAERMRKCLPPDALLFSGYGATECLPVSVIESRDLLGEVRVASENGAGTCVGVPLPDNDVRIIRVDDGPIAEWSDDLLVPQGDIGEITVAGPSVSERYHDRPDATALHKIRDGERIVHRVGDLGWLDEHGRLWFCGRKSQRVRTAWGDLNTEQIEPIANTVRGVRRSALVGVGPAGQQQPVVCVETERGVRQSGRNRIAAEVLRLVADRGVRTVLFHPKFPVDVRHNAKIGRERLARWASRRAR
ncbi:fatty acid CoA ligase family protein [Allokutzneria albata]|uniref:Acyl-CoA synthetase (AMP-forming)/AMP-acid ligase II n=1 Tax=Allokutzneria albata TaxID=211114 RepID=A0A1G9T5V3_ALLAB|nr:fatty acid CoA ligase family protein [Allokutzneria albata]SDM43018.1 Acyl-CoA synthetase (AMP-forming)/AMP-acid ligase II [Allokutzneria albata]